MEKEKQQKTEVQKEQNQEIEDYGQVTLEEGEHRIRLLNIIGEIEGHECLASNAKTTKYEHVIPQLAAWRATERGGSPGSHQHSGRRCRIGTCHSGNDRVFKQAYGVTGFRRQPFHWCAVGSFSGLFLYCSHRNHDDSSGTDDWIDYRRSSDL